MWKLLGAIKTEFGRFGEALSATQKKLEEATANISRASRRTELIRNRLRSVEELPESDAAGLLGEGGWTERTIRIFKESLLIILKRR